MRKLKLSCVSFLVISFLSQPVKAQVFENASQYIDHIGTANQDLTLTYLSYISAAAHGKSARKVEKRRQEVLDKIYYTRQVVAAMLPWKGDRTYKDTTVAYLKLLETVFREDYAKIVNMEEIAEQSYDAMEAYLLAQQKAEEKLEEARLKQQETTRRFAKKNNVNLVDSEDATSIKGDKASDVIDYHNEIYLIFFKPYKQEAYLLAAFEKGDLVALEQNINSLEKISTENLEKINAVKAFNGDASMIIATRDALNFYRSEAKQARAMTEFYLKKDKFEKMKKAFDTKKQKDRTQQDIDEYNHGVNEWNQEVKDFNNLSQQLNKERTTVLNNWNKKSDKFMDEHMPVQKKVKQ